MTENDIYLCLCTFAVTENNTERELPQKEYCLCADGNYYDPIDFMRYETESTLDKKYIVRAQRMHEDALKPDAKETLKKMKKRLLDVIGCHDTIEAENIESFIQGFSHITLVDCFFGLAKIYNGQIGVIPKGKREAIMYQGKYYDLYTGENLEMKRPKPGDVVFYKAQGMDIESMGDAKYKEKLLHASMILTTLQNQSPNPRKTFVIR